MRSLYFLLPFGSFSLHPSGKQYKFINTLSTPFWEFLIYRLKLMLVALLIGLSTPFWEFPIPSTPRPNLRRGSNAFYSLLGVSDPSKEREFAANIYILLTFYSLLGVSIYYDPLCSAWRVSISLSTPFWEFRFGLQDPHQKLYTNLRLSTPFWEFHDCYYEYCVQH